MMEVSHAELEKYHYRAVKENVSYRLEGMMDVLREELSMSFPSLEPKELEPKEQQPNFPQIPPNHKLYRELQQTRGMVLYLQKKLNGHLDRKKRGQYID